MFNIHVSYYLRLLMHSSIYLIMFYILYHFSLCPLPSLFKKSKLLKMLNSCFVIMLIYKCIIPHVLESLIDTSAIPLNLCRHAHNHIVLLI